MLTSSMQLKAKVRNLSKGDDARAKILIRNFFMERFLERTALSPYRNNFILKGGMLVAAIVGLETRATMDIDTTVKSLPLTMENARKVIEETVMARENANTRMRDFYDVYILTKRENIDYKALHDAFLATCEKRGTTSMIPRLDAILETVRIDPFMKEMWDKYRQENFFVGDLTWEDVNVSVKTLIEKVFSLS